MSPRLRQDENTAENRTIATRYRIVSMAPGETEWVYRVFHGSTGDDVVEMHKALRVLKSSPTPGKGKWRFKIEGKTTITYDTDWFDV